MTGSGKTGLGIGLIEEAAIDHIPVIAIDPKGDLGNLLLSFPDLKPADFAPWVDPRAAAEAGPAAGGFRRGPGGELAQGPRRLGPGAGAHRAAARGGGLRIYTPGSTAGLPLSVLKAFTPPPAELRADADLYREHVQGTVTGLLTLLGIEADPADQPRAHPGVQRARQRVAAGPRARPRRADRPDPEAAVQQARRARPRELLPGARTARPSRCD